MKKSRLVTLATLAAVGAYGFQGFAEVKPKNTYMDYSGYTYTYTEDGVEKTARLTDEATTTDQMIGLLKAVYTDPTLPGIQYGYNYNGVQLREIDYNDNGHKHIGGVSAQTWPYTKNDFFPNPNEDGMTLLLVQMKEDWTSKMAKNNAPNHAPANAGGKDYFIAENRIDVIFNDNVITAVKDVKVDSQVVGVTYYNMMGIPSDQPYHGVNIAVYKLSNGLTVSQKVIN